MNVLSDSITSQGASITWKIPFNHDNVVVNYYQVIVSEEQFGTPPLTLRVGRDVNTYTLEALQEYCTYQFTVAAGNDIFGTGPNSNISFTTLEAGRLGVCSNWGLWLVHIGFGIQMLLGHWLGVLNQCTSPHP